MTGSGMHTTKHGGSGVRVQGVGCGAVWGVEGPGGVRVKGKGMGSAQAQWLGGTCGTMHARGPGVAAVGEKVALNGNQLRKTIANSVTCRNYD